MTEVPTTAATPLSWPVNDSFVTADPTTARTAVRASPRRTAIPSANAKPFHLPSLTRVEGLNSTVLLFLYSPPWNSFFEAFSSVNRAP